MIPFMPNNAIMPLIFLGLAIASLICIGVEVFTGISMYRAGGDYNSFHMLFGMFMSIFICLLHTIAMFHLIGSGKDLKEHVKDMPEAEEIISLLADIKRKSFPLITFAIFANIAAPVTGAAVKWSNADILIHQICIVIVVALNLTAFWVEFVAIRNNFGLMLYADIKQSEREEKGMEE